MNEALYLAFENYCNNEMSQEEKMEFEVQLQNDADIREKFEIYQESNRFLETKFSSETLDFKKNLEAISKANFSEDKKDKSKVIAFKPWYLAVAASVTILFGTWIFMQNNLPKYEDYSQHETAMFVERSVGDANLNKAQDAFNAQDYVKAVLFFEKVSDLKNPELQYFYAISLIETNNFAKAEIFLKNIKTGTSVYKDKATWNLALSNLKQKKYDKCKAYLKQIPHDAEDYDKAQKLMKDLN